MPHINLPRSLRVGGGCRLQLADTLRELGLERPLIVSDAFICEQSYYADTLNSLTGIDHHCFNDVVPDPTTDSVSACLKTLEQHKADCVVAIGGGSAIDTAKAAAAMHGRQGQLRNHKVPASLDSGLPIVAIPTTAGTGSEATRVAVVTDTETQEKMLCMGLGLMPLAALVDFECTLAMPYRLTADTGIDSLCHALEAYVSRKANAFTDDIALSCMRSIYQHLPTACAEPNNYAAREAMMLAATQGGIAFSNASVTLIHGMSRPIGAHYHVPHGLSNAMLLPTITRWSISGAEARYAECSRAMTIAEPSDSDALACEKLCAALEKLCNKLQVPTPQDYGIAKADWEASLDLMAQQALDSGSPNNNPRIPNAEEIISLYQAIYA